MELILECTVHVFLSHVTSHELKSLIGKNSEGRGVGKEERTKVLTNPNLHKFSEKYLSGRLVAS